MADLKKGTTVGGLMVWHQGNFPLYPTGDSVLYKTYKLYSEFDKPQAADNDFVSKAQGGKYSAPLTVTTSLSIADSTFYAGGIFLGNGDGNSIATCNIDLVSWNGIGIKSTTGSRTVAIDTKTGTINTNGFLVAAKWVISQEPVPTNPSHLTRKDYVDGLINNANTNANSRVLKAGDRMTGPLIAPSVSLDNEATQPTQAARLSQVVVKATVLNYGTF